MLEPISMLFIELIAGQLVSLMAEKYVSIKLQKTKIQQEIKAVIEHSLKAAIENYPETESILENFDIEGYLKRSNVVAQLEKIYVVFEEPDENVLFDEWVSHAGIQTTKNLKLILRHFIRELYDSLRNIPEIRTILHDKDERQTYALVRSIHESVVAKPKLSTIDYPISGIKNTGSTNVELEAQIDILKNLYRDGNPNASLRQLKQIESQISSLNPSNKIIARLFSTIGGCLVALEREKEAAEYFTKAFQIDSENPNIMANYALAKIVNGDKLSALKIAEQCLQINLDHTLARIIRFEILARRDNFQSIDELIEPKYLNEPSYTRIIGLMYRDKKDYINSEKYLRMSLAIENNIYTRLALATVLIEQNLPKSYFPHTSFTTDNIYEKASEALTLVDMALNYAQSRDNFKLIQNIKASRAGIRALMGDLDGAKRDCDEIIDKTADHLLALHNRALIAISERDFKYAINLFFKIPEGYLSENNFFVPFIISYIETNQFEESNDLINKHIPSKHDNDEKYFDYIVLRAWSYFRQNENGEVINIRDNLLKQSYESARKFEALGLISRFLKDYQQAINNLEICYYQYIIEEDKNRIAEVIADIYYELRDYDNAIIWFEKLPFNILSSKFNVQQYVISLFYLRLYSKVFDFIERCYAIGIKDIVLLEIYAWLAQYMGDYEKAIDLYSEMILKEPNKVKYKLEYVLLLYRKNNTDLALRQLEGISFNIKEPWDLLEAAELYSVMGNHSKALRLGYQARKKGIDNAQIHIAYVHLFLRAEGEIDIDVDVVQVNTAILLGNDANEHWIKITDIEPISENDMEYSPVSEQANLLLGKKVGDAVEFRRSTLQDLVFTIKKIQSVFVQAFQETMDEFGVRFPEEKSLQRITIRNNDFSTFLEFVAHSDIFIEKISKYYVSGNMTIEQFAYLIGKNQLLLFLALQKDSERRIFASLGTPEDQNAQRKIIEGANSTTLSLSGLLTLSYLNFLDYLPQRFQNIYCSQKLVDFLNKTQLELDIEKTRGRKTIQYLNNRFIISEFSPDFTIKTIDYIEEIYSFIKSHCTIVPISSEFVDNLHQHQLQDAKNGNVEISISIVAKQTNSPILADDVFFRRIAMKEYGVPGFCTQELLRDLVHKYLLSFNDYANACSALAEMNYFYLSLTVDDIDYIMREDQYSLSNRLDAMLRMCLGANTDEGMAIKFASKLIKRVWFASTLYEQKIFILERILHYLTLNRTRDLLLRSLNLLLNWEFMLAPFQLRDIHKEINLWIKLHPTNESILFGRRIDLK